MAYDLQFQVDIFPVLMSAFDTYLASVYGDRLYSQTAPPKTPHPVCIYQSQDGGGSRQDYIDQNGWAGKITFRSIDITQSGAWNKLRELSLNLPLVIASGYEIQITPSHPQWLPIDKTSAGNIYTAALIVDVGIYKA